MTKLYKEITDDRKGTPNVMHAFSQLAQSTTKEGAIDKKTKELIALAIGIACLSNNSV
ncbi:carboxymuconolactone decarboxylase family protein [Francisellaceae bacterium]|nr:carboxymuconolactone decarboxylase family protein [Francisellaceae bacterium]